MRKNFKYNIIGLALLLVTLVSCDSADQDASPVISPDNYPTVTFTAVSSVAAEEHGTVIATISTDKAIDRDITFSAIVTGGTAEEGVDYKIEKIVLAAFTTEVDIVITGLEDDLYEDDENFQFTLEISSLGEVYLVTPTVFPTYDITFKNTNDPTLLEIVFAWDTDEDQDIVTFSAIDGPWGNGGATTANPEFDNSIWLSDPVGIYYVNLVEWGNGSCNYTFTIGYPDGTNEVITGTYDADNVSSYVIDVWPFASWGTPDTYRLLKVENTGTSFVVTAL